MDLELNWLKCLAFLADIDVANLPTGLTHNSWLLEIQLSLEKFNLTLVNFDCTRTSVVAPMMYDRPAVVTLHVPRVGVCSLVAHMKTKIVNGHHRIGIYGIPLYNPYDIGPNDLEECCVLSIASLFRSDSIKAVDHPK